MSTPADTGHKQGGATRFQPGESGNPKGRPPGARNKLGEKFLEELTADFDTNGKAAIAKVRDERPDAYLRTIASVLPVPKSRAVTIELPELKTAEDGLAALNVIVKAVSAGDLSVDEGQHLAALIGEHRKAVDLVDIEARLKALEGARK